MTCESSFPQFSALTLGFHQPFIAFLFRLCIGDIPLSVLVEVRSAHFCLVCVLKTLIPRADETDCFSGEIETFNVDTLIIAFEKRQ